MRTYDFSPLYRSAIEFDRLAQLFDDATRSESQVSYPPYNIELVSEDKYRITMAVAGFERSELEIETERDTLKIVGRKQKEDAKRTYLHRGIAARDFEHRFQLADHVKVVGAKLENGLLSIELAREVPEALKPRTLDIGAADIERRDPADPYQRALFRTLAAGSHLHAGICEMLQERVRDPGIDIEKHDVGVGRMRGCPARQPRMIRDDPGQPFRQHSRMHVIVGTAMHMLLQRVDAGRCQPTHLPHAAAQHLARAPRLLDEIV